jgi:hypothetical protein
VLPLTQPATGRYATGKQVLDRLVAELPASAKTYAWNLRIAKDGGNMFSSPDGTIFVDEQLGRFLDTRAGLWAAALSHEVAHIIRRDWARRYLYRRSLQESALPIVIGSEDAAVSSWVEPKSSAGLYDAFCQRQELEADEEGLMLMARAGFHPDFMPALYLLLRAGPLQLNAKLLDSSHPPWDKRLERLQAHSVDAAREFSRLWPAPYASPGGDPPVLIYIGAISVNHSSGGGFQLQVHLRCENMYGGAGVTLHLTAQRSTVARDLRLDTGCTSNNTVLTFTIRNSDISQEPMQGMITVLDDGGTLVSRQIVPRLIR